MNKQLEEIKEALSKATPGPWKWETLQYQLVSDSGPVISAEIHYTDTPMLGWKESDANLISNAPEWLASLVAEVERLEKQYELQYRNANYWNHEHSKETERGDRLRIQVEEMQNTIETAFNIACEEFETVNQLELVRATLGATIQSLKGDKP